MAADIMLDIDRMESEVYNRNRRVLESIQDAMHMAGSAVATLGETGWRGEAQEAFAAKFERCQTETKRLCEQIERLQHALRTIGEEGSHMTDVKSKAVEATL